MASPTSSDVRVTTVVCDSNKFVVCCEKEKYNNSTRIRVFDGKTIWHDDLPNKILPDDNSNAQSVSHENNLIKQLFEEKITIVKGSDGVKILSTNSTLLRTMKSCPSEDQASEIGSLMFLLSDEVTRLKDALTKAQTSDASWKISKVVTDLDSHKKGAPQKLRKRTGMSVINPMSKKLKEPQKISYD